MYRVGLGRWFGSDERGQIVRSVSEPDSVEPQFVVLCDFNAAPLTVAGDPYVLPISRSKGGKPVKQSAVGYDQRSHRMVLFLAEDASFKLDEGGLSLDLPADDGRNDEVLAQTPLTVDGRLLPPRYFCEDHSQRATVMIRPSGELEFVELVGSRYTVLQNEVLADDAWELLQRGEILAAAGFIDSRPESRVVTGGATGAFYGLSVTLATAASGANPAGTELSVELVLYHSHDKRYTYTNSFILRDELVESRPILVLGKIKIKHTKNVGGRVERVSDSLSRLEDEIKVFLQKKRILESCEVADRGKDLETFIGRHFDTKGRDWLVKRVADLFESENYAEKHGRNCWTLYRSISGIDGGYWDYRTEDSGVPAILEIRDAYKRRHDAMESLVRFASPDRIATED